jgi:hypothetical protein
MQGMHPPRAGDAVPLGQQEIRKREQASPVPLISPQQVWMALSLPQQQAVLAALVRMCRAVAIQANQPPDEREGRHDRQ